MKRRIALLAATSLLAMQGCAADPSVAPEEEEDVATNASAVSQGTANLNVTNSWNGGYCAEVRLTNGLDSATARWHLVLDLMGTSVNQMWGATFSGNYGTVTARPVNYNTVIVPGGTATFNFCASRWNSAVPTIKAWNMESNAYATCMSNAGLHPTKAALAVAMAQELERWDAVADLRIGYGGRTELSSTGQARCKNGCANLLALLAQQNPEVTQFVDQNVFNPTNYSSDLNASFGRQQSLINDLRRNRPAELPPLHKLTMVAGPTNLGKGYCGPHYVFQVDNENGDALTSTQAANLKNTLCFFGYGTCGGNAYIAFQQTTTGCPTGRTCVAIDPTDGDNSSTSTTTAGSAPTYPLNRVYNPTNSLLGTQCITTSGLLGTLTSRCSRYPWSCGYLYCIAN